MFVLGNFLFALAKILDIVLFIYMIVLFARAILSWFDPNPYGGSPFRPKMPRGMANFYTSLKAWTILLTEPLLRPIRRRVRIPGLPIDVAFIILVLAVLFLRIFLVGTLMGLAIRLS